MSGTATAPDGPPRKADAFVVSCIDPRTTGDTAMLLAALGRADRYSEMRVAGAALAAVDTTKPAWNAALWENLAASRQLHGIRKVTFINHRDCGAMHAWAGRRIDDPMEEERLHADVLRRAAAELRRRHPDLLIELKLMNLDGTTQVIPCEVCVPAGFRPETVGPAAQILAAGQGAPMEILPGAGRDGAADPAGFAELLRARASGGAALSAEEELAVLSQGITRYGLSAQQAREISAGVFAALRPTGAEAGRDALDFLRSRADAAGRIGVQDLRDAARLYRRLAGGVSVAQAERRVAGLADREGLVPRPHGVWPFLSTRWFQELTAQSPAGTAPAGKAAA